MAKIKTRDAVKGTIKTIDKAAVASERMKSAYTNGKVGIMSRQQAISSSLTGREMVQSTTQGSWRKAKMVQFIPLRVTLGMNVSREIILSEAA